MALSQQIHHCHHADPAFSLAGLIQRGCRSDHERGSDRQLHGIYSAGPHGAGLLLCVQQQRYHELHAEGGRQLLQNPHRSGQKELHHTWTDPGGCSLHLFGGGDHGDLEFILFRKIQCRPYWHLHHTAAGLSDSIFYVWYLLWHQPDPPQ